ncbi:ABC transporter permease [Streptomyces luteireticuli]|uniref:ABC transporter permease n=1 Tax=Streptomyces luteireticuli TaxID=173858 RepID=UPI0035576595
MTSRMFPAPWKAARRGGEEPGTAPPGLLRPARLPVRDILALGVLRLRTRPARALLSALGISIGVATMVVVVGIPASGRQALADDMAQLGTNLLKVQKSTDAGSVRSQELPERAAAMAARIGPVRATTAVGRLPGLTVGRSDRVPAGETSGVSVATARGDFRATLGTRAHAGALPGSDTDQFPTVVLGATAAQRLGITDLAPRDGTAGPQLRIGEHWFTVTGILRTQPLLPELDSTALVGWTAAKEKLGFSGHPSTVYVRARESALDDVRAVLAATVNPERPSDVTVSRPSDALRAKRMTETAFSSLFLGLAAVALLVGGVGVANTMVISVLERRTEIGLRRALGACRGQIRVQFLTESVVLCLLGGLAGITLGIAGTTGYAASQGWPTVLPLPAVLGGLGSALGVGALAGLYPAVRASRLTPTEALATA